MSDIFREFAVIALACSAFWSVMIGAAAHSLSWFAFAAVCAALAMFAWSE